MVDSGHLRERLTFLYLGLRTDAGRPGVITEMLGVTFPRSKEINAERDFRSTTTLAKDQLTTFEREVNARTDLDAWTKGFLIYQKTEELLLSGDHPDTVYPPLSQDERNAVVDQNGRLRWAPAENYFSVWMSSGLQQHAQVTGGLVKTGTSSGGSFVFIHAAKEMQRLWGVPVDLGLLRLALLGWEIPTGNHTFHELMRGSQLGDPILTYRDSWDRYRHLAPLTEMELRQQVAPDRKFPEEHAWEQVPLQLDERQPAAAQFAHLPIVDQPAYLLLDWPAGKGAAQVVGDRLRDTAVLVASLAVPNPAPRQVVVEFTAGLSKDISSLPGSRAGPGGGATQGLEDRLGAGRGRGLALGHGVRVRIDSPMAVRPAGRVLYEMSAQDSAKDRRDLAAMVPFAGYVTVAGHLVEGPALDSEQNGPVSAARLVGRLEGADPSGAAPVVVAVCRGAALGAAVRDGSRRAAVWMTPDDVFYRNGELVALRLTPSGTWVDGSWRLLLSYNDDGPPPRCGPAGFDRRGLRVWPSGGGWESGGCIRWRGRRAPMLGLVWRRVRWPIERRWRWAGRSRSWISMAACIPLVAQARR